MKEIKTTAQEATQMKTTKLEKITISNTGESIYLPTKQAMKFMDKLVKRNTGFKWVTVRISEVA
jgi:hypothetical protein